MNVYMLQDKKSGLFCRRGSGYNCWVEQNDASIWTSRRGPAQAITYVSRMKKRQPIIRTFKLEPNDE